MEEFVLIVNGMHCEGCENRIQNSISQIDGVEKTIANHNDGTVKIKLNKNVDKKLIIEAIEDIGFEVIKD